MRYYLYVKDSKANWGSDIGDHHDFDSIEKADEAIKTLFTDEVDLEYLKYKIEDSEGNIIKIIELEKV